MYNVQICHKTILLAVSSVKRTAYSVKHKVFGYMNVKFHDDVNSNRL